MTQELEGKGLCAHLQIQISAVEHGSSGFQVANGVPPAGPWRSLHSLRETISDTVHVEQSRIVTNTKS